MSHVEIRVTTMGFSIPINAKGTILGSSLPINDFSRHLCHWQFDQVTQEWKLLNEYFYFDKENERCYFPLYELDRFKEYLDRNRVVYSTNIIPPVEGVDAKFQMLPWVDYKNEKQRGAVEYLTNENSGPVRGLALQTGSGKLAPLYSLIKTPTGWIRNGDIKLGQELRMPDGTIAPVVGIFPQGEVPCYRIYFEDGRWTDCGLEHLWKVRSSKLDNTYRIITTKDILDNLNDSSDDLYMGVPLISHPIMEDIDLPVDPYELGVLLREDLESSIPEVYMESSPKQKLSLLHGVFNTPLGEDPTTYVAYRSKKFALSRQIQTLIRSLGGVCRVKEIDESTCSVFGYLTGPYKRGDDIVSDSLKIDKVEYIGNHEAQCIMVDHPDHLYITDDYIVTHNTVSAIWSVQKLGKRTMLTMTSRLEQWVKEICKYTSLEEDDCYIIQGVGSLTKLFSQIDKGINPKFILASVKTMRLYIDYGPTYQHLPHPSQACEKLGVGIVAGDESHESFVSSYLMTLLFNPKIFIPITATFLSNDPFVKNIFDHVYPKDIQFEGGEYDRYVDITSYRYTGGSYLIKPYHYTRRKMYSQVAFEDFLLSKKGEAVWKPFVTDALIPIIKEQYINICEKGEKLLILCATTDMGEEIAKILKREFRDKTVSTFYSGMSVTILDKYDIILSTPGSAGTGRDISGLRSCIVLDNTKSEVRNAQYLGRLRGPPQMMNQTKFSYVYFGCIPKHVQYHQARSMLYGTKAKTMKHRSI